MSIFGKESRQIKEGYFFSNKDLRNLIVPLVIEQILIVAIGLIDSIMVSKAGEEAVSGVSLVDSIFILLIAIFGALGGGGAVIAGRFIGRRKPEKASEAVDHLIVFLFVASMLVAVVLFVFRAPLLHLVFGDVDDKVMDASMTYLTITAFSIPAIALYNGASALFRAMGNSNRSMMVTLIMNIVHVAGNAVLLYCYDMGVEGVAIPTLVTRIGAAVIMLIFLRNQKNTIHFSKPFKFRYNRLLLKDILYIGIPSGLENGMFQLGKLVVLSLVSTMGTTAIAANAVANNIAALAVIPGMAMSFSILAVTSQCAGAGDFEQARFYTRKLLKIEYIILIVANAIMLACLPLFIKIYNLSDATADLATKLIILHAVLCCVIWPLSFSLPNTLRASGDVMFTLIWAAISMWVFRIALANVFGTMLGWGLLGVWIAMIVDWIFRTTLFVIRYKRGKWVTKVRMDSDKEWKKE